MYCDQVVALELVHVYAFYILGNSGELRRSVDTKRTKVSERFKLHFIGFQCQSKVIIFLLISDFGNPCVFTLHFSISERMINLKSVTRIRRSPSDEYPYIYIVIFIFFIYIQYIFLSVQFVCVHVWIYINFVSNW